MMENLTYSEYRFSTQYSIKALRIVNMYLMYGLVLVLLFYLKIFQSVT